jgi:YD repeat-containing protein
LIDNAWTEKTDWRLPFFMDNYQASSEGRGGKTRDEHFQWVDLNSDGFQDLVVHTTATGHLYDATSNALMLGGNSGIAFINKGKNGPGWIRDDSLFLPARLMEDGDDVGRRIVDLDGDGIPELTQARYVSDQLTRRTHFLMPSGAYRWNPPSETGEDVGNAYDLPTSLILPGGNDRGILVMDLNSDGLPDVLRSHNEDTGFFSKTWLNHGLRTNSPWILESEPVNTSEQINSYDFPYPLHYESSAYDENWRISYGFQPADINGDGLPDILYSDVDNPATSGSDNLVFLNTGNGWSTRTTWGLPDDNRIYLNADDRFASERRSRLEDLNGDGFPDLITGLIGSTPKVWYNNCRPEVLTSVVDGFASELSVEYKRLNDPTPTTGFGSRVYEKHTGILPGGHASIIDSRLVVSRYSEPNGKGGRRHRSQRYGDLRYDRYNESSLGFGWVEAKDELNDQTTRTETSRVYPFGGSPLQTETWVRVNAADLSAVLVGVTSGRKRLSLETAEYAELPTQSGAGGTIRRPVQIFSQKTLFDLKGTEVSTTNLVSRTTTTQNLVDFDAYGFVKNSTVASLDGSVVAAASDYTHTVDANRWHLGRLSQTIITKSGPTSGVSKPTLTKKSSFTYAAATGLLKTETIEPGSTLSSTKTYTRDGFGNVTGTSVTGLGITRSGSSLYDSQGRFFLAESNQLGHMVSYHYDSQRALLLSTTDINGKTNAFGYDAFGTLIRTWHPDGTQTGESTGYTGNGQLPASVAAMVTNPIQYFRAKQTSASPVGKVYLDALGREIVAETTILRDATATGAARYSKVYSVTQYDSLGRKVLVSEPFGSGDVPKATLIDYDLLGRVIKTTHPDGQFDLALEFNTVTLAGQPVSYSKVQNRSSGILKRWEDQHGHLIQSKDPSDQVTSFLLRAELMSYGITKLGS